MKVKHEQLRASMLCLIAFMLGCLLTFSGCAWGTATRVGAGQHQYETGTGIYIEKEESLPRKINKTVKPKRIIIIP